jgi:two-component system response regulator MprA
MVEDARVLVVDDDDPIRTLSEKVLSREGFAVDIAHDGIEALDKIGRLGDLYCAILLDLMMPRMSGFEVISHLKARNPELLPRVIVMTAATSAQLEQIDSTEIHTILRKPFDIGELRRVASECANRFS